MRERLIISLSSGELRKFHIARTLLAAPRLLILDNPFVGLDAAARGQLCDLLRSLVSETGLQVILELSRDSDIPDFITHVVVVEDNMTVLPKQSLSDYRQSRRDSAAGLTADERQRILGLPPKDLAADKFYAGGEILSFHDVSISYFGRTILDHVSWQVAEGERWALLGPNGSGKSTLLSLVSADNPQGYACDIRLFGHRRGTGESIWDVKRHIGYVSPELHRAYRRSMAAIDVVASGMHDSVGLYVRPTDEEREACRTWMDIFRIGSLADADFRLLSSGEQRMCLLARAFVKDPELLILDEPLHGLDTFNRALVRDIIEVFCARTHKTLIMVTHYPEELPECITPGCVKRLT